MKCVLFWGFLFLDFFNICNAQVYKGIVTNESNEPIAGATLFENNTRQTISDSNGVFSFVSTVKDRTEISVTAPFYKTEIVTVWEKKQNKIVLHSIATNMDSVSVSAFRLKRGNNSFSYLVKDVTGVNSLFGESDILKYISILPGVSQGMEGGSANYVRGAGNGNNRIELDNVPVYGSTHLFGIFSVFHPSIVKDAQFQLGGINAGSGNLLSSLLQVNTVVPEINKTSYDFSISPLMADGSVSGFIKQGKSGFQVAGRTTVLPALFYLYKAISNIGNSTNLSVNDIYGNYYSELNKTSNIKATFYASKDYLRFKTNSEENSDFSNFGLSWSNAFGKIEWNKKVNNNFSTQLFSYANFFKNRMLQEEFLNRKLVSGILINNKISEFTIKGVLRYQPNTNQVLMGASASSYQFESGSQKVITSAKTAQWFPNLYKPFQGNLFVEWLYTYNKLRAKLDLRGNYYKLDDYQKLIPEFRFLTSYFISKDFGIEATYDNNAQFFHSLEGLPLGWSLDITIPSFIKANPEKSEQFYIGMFAGNTNYYATLGVYQRSMNNLVYYNGTNNLLGGKNGRWEEDIVTGKGFSKGVEFWMEKRKGKWLWSIAYTLSKTDRQFDEINDGKIFPFKFDRRHIFNYQSTFMLRKIRNKEKKLNLSIYLSSGNRLTIPVGKYEGITPPYWDQLIAGNGVSDLADEIAYYRPEMTTLNGYSMPNYFRFDAGYSILKKKEKHSREFVFSIYNITNRHNPYLVFYEKGNWKQLSILPIVPSIKWRVFL